MDQGNKVLTTDMTTLQSSLTTIATNMKQTAVLTSSSVDTATYTGKITAEDVINIRTAINGLEKAASENCCQSNCCQTCEGCQSRSCQTSKCQSCQGCQTCQKCQDCQSASQCREQNCNQCAVYQCT